MAKLVLGTDINNTGTPSFVRDVSPAHYIEKNVVNGMLVSGNSFINLDGVTTIGSYQLYRAYTNGLISEADMSNITNIQESGCQLMFNNCTTLTSANLSNLVSIGYYACNSMFQGCTNLKNVNLSSLQRINNFFACTSMFQDCTNLENVNLSSLQYIDGYYGARQMFYNCTKLKNVDLSSLEITGSGSGYSASQMFYGCTSLINVKLDNLKSVNYEYGFHNVFWDCTSLEYIDFPSLANIPASNSLRYLFEGCKSFKKVQFFALTPQSFGSYRNQFDGLLSGCSNVIARFPKIIESTISSWSSVVSGFSGTNTTILFDIITSLEGIDTNIYTRNQKDSTNTATAWINNNTLYYTNGINEPQVGDTIYSDPECTQAVTTINSIA